MSSILLCWFLLGGVIYSSAYDLPKHKSGCKYRHLYISKDVQTFVEPIQSKSALIALGNTRNALGQTLGKRNFISQIMLPF